jgi:hypothetical protein
LKRLAIQKKAAAIRKRNEKRKKAAAEKEIAAFKDVTKAREEARQASFRLPAAAAESARPAVRASESRL